MPEDVTPFRTTGDEDAGLTPEGFLPKPFARLLEEKLALVRELLGDDVDLGGGAPSPHQRERSACRGPTSRRRAACG